MVKLWLWLKSPAYVDWIEVVMFWLTAYKVVQYEEGSEGTDAEQILDLRTKLDGLITALSAANIFKLEDIPDENPNLDRDTAGLDWSQPPE